MQMHAQTCSHPHSCTPTHRDRQTQGRTMLDYRHKLSIDWCIHWLYDSSGLCSPLIQIGIALVLYVYSVLCNIILLTTLICETEIGEIIYVPTHTHTHTHTHTNKHEHTHQTNEQTHTLACSHICMCVCWVHMCVYSQAGI